MREWIRSRNRQFFVLVALAVIAIVTTTTLVVVLRPTAEPTDAALVAEPSDAATPTPVPTISPTAVPTFSPLPATTASPDAAAAPRPVGQAKAPVAQPAPPQSTLLPPGIIGMDPGYEESCAQFAPGTTFNRTFKWTARDGNTVDVYVAYTDTDVLATSGFSLLASNRPASGSVNIPRACPSEDGLIKLATVKLIAKNALGSAAPAYYYGL